MAKWPDRQRVVSRFVPYESNVIDLGGYDGEFGRARPDLKSYVCIDYDRQSNPTYYADFNKGQFPDVKIKDAVVVCQGLLEHLNDIPSFLKTIHQYGDFLVMTYYQRAEKFVCWKNHFTYVTILNLLDVAGWRVEHIEPVQITTELVFVCRSKKE